MTAARLALNRVGCSQPAPAWLLLAAAALWAPAAQAADPAPALPNAGAVLRDLQRPDPAAGRAPSDAALPARPAAQGAAASAPAGERFTLRAVKITGSEMFSAAQLQPLLADAIGQPIDLAGLQALADRLTRRYREAGYPVATALLPAQDIADGVVQMAVVEGRYSAITVQGSVGRAAARLPLAGLAAGDVIADAPLERALLLASDLPGLRVRSTLQPGASVGTSELVVELAPGETMSGSVEADNHGGISTGVHRLGGGLSLNNAAGLGDALNLRVLGSEAGLLKYGRLSWQVPINRWGSKLGLATSALHYRLGGSFSALEASGDARINSLFVAHPLLRSRGANLNLQLLVDDKRLHDRVGATNTANDKAVRLLALGASGDRTDTIAGGGLSSFSATATRGQLRLNSLDAAAVDAATAKTAGQFSKLALTWQRQQAIGTWLGGWARGLVGERSTLNLQFTAQWASKNLDSSEKLALGGVGAVRAHASGEAPSDRAALLNVELRRPLAAGWQATLFADAAQGRTNAQRWDGATGAASRQLSGAGLGLAWTLAPGMAVQAQWAYRLGQAPASGSDDKHRAWVQASWSLGPG